MIMFDSVPGDWEQHDTSHSSSGVVANNVARFTHPCDYKILIWSDVQEDGADYTVSDGDEYVVEISREGEHIGGESYETRDRACQMAQRAMERLPRV